MPSASPPTLYLDVSSSFLDLGLIFHARCRQRRVGGGFVAHLDEATGGPRLPKI